MDVIDLLQCVVEKYQMDKNDLHSVFIDLKMMCDRDV